MRIVFRLTCFSLACILAGIMYLGWSETGFRQLVAGIVYYSGGQLYAGAVRGALLTGWSIENLQVTLDGADVRLGNVSAEYKLGEMVAWRLHIVQLAAVNVKINLKDQEDDSDKTSSLQNPLPLPEIAVPLPMLIDQVRIENLKLISADNTEITSIDFARFGLHSDSTILSLLDFTVEAEGYHARFNGHLDTAENWAMELHGPVEFKEFGVGPVAGDVVLKGPLAQLHTRVDLKTPAKGYLEGEITHLPYGLEWEAQIDIRGAQLADYHEVLPEMAIDLSGSAQGDLAAYEGQFTGRIDYLFFNNYSVELDLKGDQNQIEFAKIIADNGRGRAHLTDGLLAWQDGLAWRGKLDLQRYDLAQIQPDYPGSITGNLVSDGMYDESGLRLKAQFSNISGELRGHELEGSGQLQVADHTVTVTELRLFGGEGALSIDGSAAMKNGLDKWNESLNWDVNVVMNECNPGLLFADYPGSINAGINSSGTRTLENVNGVLEISELTGMIRKYPVMGRGEVLFRDHNVSFREFFLQSGSSKVVASGTAGESLEIKAHLESANLGEFIHGAAGTLNIDAELTGTRTAPLLDARLGAKELELEGAKVNDFQAEFSGWIGEGDVLHGSARGDGLSYDGFLLDSATVQIDGTSKNHRFTLSAAGYETNTQLTGKGLLSQGQLWSGEIADLNINHPLTGIISQEGSSPFQFSHSKAALDSLCLALNAAKICASVDYITSQDRWMAKMNWQQIDLSQLNKIPGLPVSFKGTSSAELSVAGDTASIETATGYVQLKDVVVAEADNVSGDQGDWGSVPLDRAQLDIALQEGTLQLGLGADFSDSSNLNLRIETEGVGKFSQDNLRLPLQGRLDADIQSLGFIAPLTKYMVIPSGHLQGGVDITGTFLRPVAEGKLFLEDGTIEMPNWGVAMEDVSFDLRGVDETLHVEAKATSGPGWLEATGDLAFDDNEVSGVLRFVGDDFATVNLPEYEIRTSPDLQMVLTRNGAVLTGKIHVPYAVLMPEEMSGSIAESDDVIYEDELLENRDTWNFATSLNVSLGDDVRLDGYGITGSLRGQLTIEKNPDTVMTGAGELELADGVFSIYGKTLDIVRSRLLFAGGPVDNPGIDVRAEKLIADKNISGEIIRLGVDVGGTADDLEFTLFSDPYMEDSDILAYMVVGRSMSETGKDDEGLLGSAAMALGLHESIDIFGGATKLLPIDDLYFEGMSEENFSLVVGKQVTKEFYIGYDHNFFDQLGEIRLRYYLGKGFSAETRSSAKATGADLLYSFER